jgi:SAM-dependent methyltransferase
MVPRRTNSDPTYVMGRSAEERERLIQQADLFGPITERFLRAAGVAPGMRVLDVGCGVGDVTLLCADLVGPDGSVVGIDRDPTALARARERVADAALDRVELREGDFREMGSAEPFDAVVGRAVLMWAADPAEAIRRVLPHVRSGGIVAFHELDFTNLVALPRTNSHDRVVDWWRRTATHAGVELQMGLKLFPVYRAAGLPPPEMHGDTILGGGPDYGGYTYLADSIRSMLPLMEQFGVATADEVDIDTLAERLRDETVSGGGVLALSMMVGAAARKP